MALLIDIPFVISESINRIRCSLFHSLNEFTTEHSTTCIHRDSWIVEQSQLVLAGATTNRVTASQTPDTLLPQISNSDRRIHELRPRVHNAGSKMYNRRNTCLHSQYSALLFIFG